MSRALRFLASGLVLFAFSGCGAGASPSPPAACDASCQDGTAVRGTREAMKLAFNLLIQGRPVGDQEGVTPCRSYDGRVGGLVHVWGSASANAVQGASFVDLEYDFQDCAYGAPPNIEPNQNYDLVLSGRVRQRGTLAVQPSSTTALLLDSDSLTVQGTVYDPPLEYAASDCALALAQQGNQVSGTICGRNTGFSF